ncbi:MAG: hypothetical protein OXT06_14665, partial [Rhodospirillaceae bacterium]|nr:hypothetical protein [Rhodospirillaceae bacterium]
LKAELEQQNKTLRREAAEAEKLASAFRSKNAELTEQLATVQKELADVLARLNFMEGMMARVEVEDGMRWHDKHGRKDYDRENPRDGSTQRRPEPMPMATRRYFYATDIDAEKAKKATNTARWP